MPGVVERLRNGAGLAVADQIVSSGLNFGFLLLAGRLLPPATFGAFTLFSASLMLALVAHSSLVSIPLTLESDRLRSVARDAIVLHSVVTIAASLLMMATAFIVGDHGLRLPLLLGALVAPVFLTAELIRRVEMARGRWMPVIGSDTVGLASRLVGLAAISVSAQPVMNSVVAVYALGSLITVVAFLALDRQLARSLPILVSAESKMPRGQGILLLLGQAASWANSQALLYLVGAGVGLASVGTVGASQTLLQPLNILLLGAGNWSLPHLVRMAAERRQAGRAIANYSLKLGLSLGAVSLVYSAILLPAVPVVSRLTYGAKYGDMTSLVALWAGAYVLSAAVRGLSTGVTALRRADIIAAGSLAGLPFVAAVAIIGRDLGGAMVPIGSAIGSLIQISWMGWFLIRSGRGSA